jgi:hypothetical protein
MVNKNIFNNGIGKHRFMRRWDWRIYSASVVIKVTYFKLFYDDGDGRFAGDEG